jgi:hypothetical protein
MMAHGLCVPEGGFTDALQRFMRGATIDEVAKQLSLEPEQARKRIGKGLALVRCRYHEC